MSHHTDETSVKANVKAFLGEMLLQLTYKLGLYLIGGAVVVGGVALAFGVSITTALWIIGVSAFGFFMFYMFLMDQT